jgi:hypothetical protein
MVIPNPAIIAGRYIFSEKVISFFETILLRPDNEPV